MLVSTHLKARIRFNCREQHFGFPGEEKHHWNLYVVPSVAGHGKHLLVVDRGVWRVIVNDGGYGTYKNEVNAFVICSFSIFSSEIIPAD